MLEQLASAHPLLPLVAGLIVPEPQGLPIEIYCFTRTTQWRRYEDIQSAISDHVIAIASELGLAAYQQPSGVDVRAVRAGAAGS